MHKRDSDEKLLRRMLWKRAGMEAVAQAERLMGGMDSIERADFLKGVVERLDDLKHEALERCFEPITRPIPEADIPF